MFKPINTIIFILVFSSLFIGTNLFAFQNIQLAESDCIMCNVDEQASVDNHHSLYGSDIIPVPTAVPYPLVEGVIGCLSCH